MTARDVPEREPFRLASGGVIDRTRSLNFTFDGQPMPGTRAIRWLQRSLPMASGWSAARSNITGRAASSAPVRKSRMR